jgi:predicted NBD/HSP70 family sugar kinase
MVPGRDSLHSTDPDAADFGAVLGARKLREIVDAAVQGMSVREAVPESSHDERLHSFIEHLADHLAMIVINIGALLDPEAVVLGGGTMVSGEELLSRLRAHVDRWLVAPPRLLLSALGEDAQLHGVIHGAMEELRKSREGTEP